MQANSRFSLRTFAPAKINLFLHVGDRRADGFHDLESLAAFADVGDELTFERSNEFSLEISGPYSTALKHDHTNLVSRAAAALSEKIGQECTARIALTKNLPVSSGIGGGSTDAAAALRGLVRLWNPAISPAILREIAEALGSDVPVCLTSVPSWMEGRGEKVVAAPDLPAMAMVLVNPRIEVSTAEVFGALNGRRGLGLLKPHRFPSSDELVDFLQDKSNDLEAPARTIAPAIGDALAALRSTDGAQLARMSGSGATSFALYKETSKAAAAAAKLSRAQPDWWVIATTFLTRAPDQ
jgi:4-diphosphocytidyl-2-C-methyl-D-erythritol kinase